MKKCRIAKMSNRHLFLFCNQGKNVELEKILKFDIFVGKFIKGKKCRTLNLKRKKMSNLNIKKEKILNSKKEKLLNVSVAELLFKVI